MLYPRGGADSVSCHGSFADRPRGLWLLILVGIEIRAALTCGDSRGAQVRAGDARSTPGGTRAHADERPELIELEMSGEDAGLVDRMPLLCLQCKQ